MSNQKKDQIAKPAGDQAGDSRTTAESASGRLISDVFNELRLTDSDVNTRVTSRISLTRPDSKFKGRLPANIPPEFYNPGPPLRFCEGELIPNIRFYHNCDENCTHPPLNTEEDARQTTVIKIRPSGGHELITDNSTEVRGIASESLQILDGKLLNGPICQLCYRLGNIKLLASESEVAHYDDLEALKASGKTCPCCALFLKCSPDPQLFKYDDRYKISVRGMRSHKNNGSDINCAPEESVTLRGIQVIFPFLNPDKKDGKSITSAYFEIYADQGTSAVSMGLTGRPVRAADNMTQPLIWLKECLHSHPLCAAGHEEGTSCQNYPLPTRVLDVGSSNGSEPFLVETNGAKGQYLTLSYRWGDTSVAKTTMSTLSMHKDKIPMNTLCRTFQDAITVTRKLSYQYLWIDSLCIIQDSREDWDRESAQMAEVYKNSVLTISACISTSADSGLFYPRKEVNAVQLPCRTVSGDTELGSYFVTDRCLSGFKADVLEGSLSQRGWCLQERVLARRLLHYGADQLHWQCSEGIWSESSLEKVSSSDNLESKLRSLLPQSPNARRPEIAGVTTIPRQVYGKAPYGTWYEIIGQYSLRELSNEKDKLPALSGIAKSFAEYEKSTYVAGLWAEDLLQGLLWSGCTFFEPSGMPTRFSRPLNPRAPSWSWASLDGPIKYPLNKLGGFTAKVEEVAVGAASIDPYGRVGDGLVKITGPMRPLQTMTGFTYDFQQFIYANADSLIPYAIPRAAFDEPHLVHIAPVWCLLVALIGCGDRTGSCNHFAGCQMGMGYGILLHYVGHPVPGVYRRIGIAQVYASDFDSTANYVILGTVILC